MKSKCNTQVPPKHFSSKQWTLAMQVSTALLAGLFAASSVQAEAVTIDSRDFIPYFGNAVYGESSAGNLVCVGGNLGKLFAAQVPLPPAPIEFDLKQLAVWGSDITLDQVTVRLERFCQAEFSPSVPVKTVLADATSSGFGGSYYAFEAMNTRVSDQQTCTYQLLVILGVNGCEDSSLSVARVRVRYDLVPPVTENIFSNGFEN
jgi:hypothetical protein